MLHRSKIGTWKLTSGQTKLLFTMTASPSTGTSFATALVAGGAAGTCVDVALFPIDTLKTRLQSPAGFWRAGGLRGIYNGLGAAAAGSAPGAALFFGTYETLKPLLLEQGDSPEGAAAGSPAISHMAAASVGEAAACLVRVPTEVVKAKMQTAVASGPARKLMNLQQTIRSVLRETHGGGPLQNLTGGLYRGYGITLFREIPFAAIQFPLYERLKVAVAAHRHADGRPCTPLQAAACGSVSGAVAAAATTPLDVLKTRLMLGADRHGVPYTSVADVWRRLLREDGAAALWSGVQPRVLWITLGGFVFFGAYEESRKLVRPVLG